MWNLVILCFIDSLVLHTKEITRFEQRVRLQCDSNTQPSDMKSDALPLCHKVFRVGDFVAQR